MIAPSSRFCPAARRIAVFRALQLGDMLCSAPALRALRRACPAAQITLIGLPWTGAFIEQYAGLIDELLVFPGAIGFPEQAETDALLPAFYRAARTRGFDLAIQLHGSGGKANEILFKLGAQAHAGFLQPGEAKRDGCFIGWPDTLPESERYNTLMRRLGISVDDPDLFIPLAACHHVEYAQLIAQHGIEPHRLVLIHPGAQLPSRRWPAERFAEVADTLASAGWQIAITGSAREAPLTGAVLDRMRAPAKQLAGATTLGGLAALVGHAQLVICNDTSLSHIAAAMKTRSVVIASGSDTRRWAPINHARHRVLADYPSCRPCAFRDCPYGHPCALNITVNRVVDVALAQLARSEESAPDCAGTTPLITLLPERGHAA